MTNILFFLSSNFAQTMIASMIGTKTIIFLNAESNDPGCCCSTFIMMPSTSVFTGLI